MKKILLVFLFLLFPGSVLARGEITNHYIDATVLSNGDLSVKELVIVENNNSTFKYLINSHDTFKGKFDDSLDSYIKSDIYNSDNVTLKKVRIFKVDGNVSFNYIYHEGRDLDYVIEDFEPNNSTDQYTTNKTKDGINVVIYNSRYNKKIGYYFEYIIKNIAVLHNDVAEVNLDILNNNHSKNSNLEMVIHIPNNLEILKKWIHGPLSGNVVLTDKDEIRIFVDKANKNKSLRMRFVFDREVISDSIKSTNRNAMDKIIEVESQLEDDEREAIRIDELKEQFFKLGFETLGALWLLGVIFSFLRVYFKHDREYESKFKGKYYKKIPDGYSPKMVGYLLNMDIADDDLASSILFMINNGIIEVKKHNTDYILSLKKGKKIEGSDRKLIELIFNGEQDVNLSHIKINASVEHKKFLQKYNNWYVFSIIESEKEKIFESTGTVKIKMMLYSFVGFLIALISLFFNVNMFIFYTLLITSIIGMVYFKTFRKRTIKGNNKYSKWVAFKRYLEDYESFIKNDDIDLWEQYLIYATTFGCNKKVYEILKKKANKKVLEKLEVYDNIIDEIKEAVINAHSNQT